MTEKQRLERRLWDIADTLRGKMGADDFRDYIFGFIFYKYLIERMHAYKVVGLKLTCLDCRHYAALIPETMADGVDFSTDLPLNETTHGLHKSQKRTA